MIVEEGPAGVPGGSPAKTPPLDGWISEGRPIDEDRKGRTAMVPTAPGSPDGERARLACPEKRPRDGRSGRVRRFGGVSRVPGPRTHALEKRFFPPPADEAR